MTVFPCAQMMSTQGVIYREGHLNRVVQKAIGYGAHPLVLSVTPAITLPEYGFDDLGAIAPGYVADMQLVDALDGRRPSHVFCRGNLWLKREGIWEVPMTEDSSSPIP